MENYQFTLRLISPLQIIEVPEFITWKEREIVSDITSFCRNDIQLFILEHASERERERGMMIYYDKSSTVNEKVKAAFISVEVIGDRLMGYLPVISTSF